MGQDCATGVCFTPRPQHRREHFLRRIPGQRQGEDVVAGIRTPQPLSSPARRTRRDQHGAGPPGRLRRPRRRPREAGGNTTSTCRTSSSPCSRTSCTCCKPATASAPPPPRSGSPSKWLKPASSTRSKPSSASAPPASTKLLHPTLDPKAPPQAALPRPPRQPGRGQRRRRLQRR